MRENIGDEERMKDEQKNSMPVNHFFFLTLNREQNVRKIGLHLSDK